MKYSKDLPVEITLDILTRVPTEKVIECKLVCTNWRNLVSHHPSFPKMHLQYHLNHPGKLGYIVLIGLGKFYYFEYNENHESAAPIERIRRINLPPPWTRPTFVGSYNGLICLGRSPCFPARSYICNPITREYVVLPRSNRDSGIAHDYWTSGFGYVSSTNEYKVVRVYAETDELVEIYIYTLGSGSGWRNLGKFNSLFRGHNWDRAGTFANGSLYWLDYELKMIVTFDLADEKFGEYLSPPPLPQDSFWGAHEIGVLDGFVFFAVRLDAEEEIWLLKNKNDSHEKKEGQSLGWTKEFRNDGRGNLLKVTKSGNVLTYIDNYLNIYDTKASTSKTLVGFQERVGAVIPHQNTLVSLRELGEEDTKIMETIDIEEIESDDEPFIQL